MNYRIFISSPGDVGREREVARRVIERVEAWFGGRVKVEGYFWEHEPMRTTGGDFQGQIPEPSTFDLVVCILWSRLGSRLHPGKHQRADGSAYESGTEYEFENAMEAFRHEGRPDLVVYRRVETPLFPPEPREEMEARLQQWEALKQFCDRWFSDEKEGAFIAAFNSYKDSGDFERTFEGHLKRLLEGRLVEAGSAAPLPRKERWWQGSPYRGLHTFEFEHEPIFFGRTKARDEVLGALRARWVEEKCPFVLIFGASGSGKSSLMRAGVMPWLVRPGVIEGVSLWRMAMLRPGGESGDLLEALARVLTTPQALPELLSDGTTTLDLAAMLRDEPKGIVGLVKGALAQIAAGEQRAENLDRPPVTRLALGLDQLEEVFTLRDRFNEENVRAFFRAIAALARSGFVWVVATLRSDFYNRCEEVPELVDLKKNRGQYHLLPPTDAELSQMIRYPAQAAGLTFAEDAVHGKLEEVIVHDAEDQAGALPLLQYAMDMLYKESSTDGVLTHEQYERIGRVAGAVARKAEETFAQLTTPEQSSLDDVLSRLVTLGEGHDEVATRRVATYDEVTRPAGAKGLVDAFLEARLFTGDRDPGGQRTVMVAHEALLRVWQRVIDWVRGNRQFLRQRVRLSQALTQWRAFREHEDYLLMKGLPLAEAEALLAQHEAALNPEEIAFIVASRTKVNREERRRTVLRRAIMIALAVHAVVALITAVIAIKQQRRAIANRNIAQEQSRLAQSEAARAEAGEAAARRESDQRAALLREAATSDLLIAADREQSQDDFSALAHYARAARYEPHSQRVAAAAWPLLFNTTLTQPVKAMEGANPIFSPDGHSALTTSGPKAMLWEFATGKLLRTFDFKDSYLSRIDDAVFSPEGRLLVTSYGNDRLRLWKVDSGEVLGNFEKTDRERFALSMGQISIAPVFTTDGRKLLTVSSDGHLHGWDTTTRQHLWETNSSPLRSLVISPDGRRFLTAHDDKTARIWDAETGQLVLSIPGHDAAVHRAIFNSDGTKILTSSEDGTARLWDALTGKQIRSFLEPRADLVEAVLSPDDQTVLTFSSDTPVQLWNVADGRLLVTLPPQASLKSAAFSPDGQRFLTVDNDYYARVWHTTTGSPVSVFGGSATQGTFSADGQNLLTSDGEVTSLWEAGSHRLPHLYATGENMSEITFSADGKKLVTTNKAGEIHLRETESGRLEKAVQLIPWASSWLHDLRFSPDAQRLWIEGSRNEGGGDFAGLWDLESGQRIAYFDGEKEQASLSYTRFSADGRFVALMLNTGRRFLCDLATGKMEEDASSRAWHFDLAEPGPETRVLLRSQDQQAEVWEMPTGKKLATLEGSKDPVASGALSLDGQFAATVSLNGEVRLWETSSAKQLLLTSGREAVFSPDGKILVIRNDTTIGIREADSGKETAVMDLHDHAIEHLAFSRDSRFLLGFGKEKLQLWNMTTRQLIVQDAPMDLGKAYLSPDSQWLLVCEDKNAHLWSTATGELVGSKTFSSGVFRVAFDPNSRTAVLTMFDSAPVIWPILPASIKDSTSFANFFNWLASHAIGKSGRAEELTSKEIQDLGNQLPSANAPTEFAQLIAWRQLSTHERTVSPFGSQKQTDVADAILRPGMSEQEAGYAYVLDADHPLVHLALAAYARNPRTADFLRRYSLDRLPDDPDLELRAAEFLEAQKQPSWALGYVKAALVHRPSDPRALALQGRLQAAGR